MSLKGELTDLSLAELIEFFCNQRKTGRLTVSYPQAPAYFYLQSGSVVHASVGSLRGIEAVFYALTQSNASFNFSTAYEPPAQTINQPWTSVVLEGLRRMDEGIEPRNPFRDKFETEAQTISATPADLSPAFAETELNEVKAEAVVTEIEPPRVVHPTPPVPVVEVEPPPAIQAKPSERVIKKEAVVKPREESVIETPVPSLPRPNVSDAFLASTQRASKFSSGPWKLAAVFAALVLIVAGIAVPWGWRVRGKAARAAEQQTQALNESAAQPQSSAPENSQSVPTDQSADAATVPANGDAADAARRERESRAREEARLKAKAAEANAAGTTPNASAQTAPAQSTGTGPKKAVVTVTYDENGRVTGASGSDPTALRIARQKRFPPGKAGSTTITIPIN
jgi:hypothetical protein